MNFDSAKNALHGFYKSVAEYVTPVSQESHFNEKGVLTPEEFLKAGSELVYKCPTWSWEKASDDSKKWKFFPDNQQYLLTRNVPCLKRVASLELKDGNEEIVENGEWLSAYAHSQNKANEEDDMGEIQDDMESLKIKESKSKNKNNTNNNNNMIHIVEDAFEAPKEKPKDNNTKNQNHSIPSNSNKKEEKKIIKKNEDELSDSFEEIPDIESFNDNDNVVSAKENKKNDKKSIKNEVQEQVQEEKQLNENIESEQPSNTQEIMEEPLNNFFSKQQEDEDEDTIVKTRTYDISITYDKYYRVPRVWLRGYDENNNPLTSQQIMQDISSDHAHKTVTIEPHPHTGVVCASIHPCRHSEVMKRFMDRLEESGKALSVNQYMFLFLKFLSAVIPTIEYDWTSGMDAQ